jgi:hypothetical protein
MLKHPDREKWQNWLERISDEMVASAVDRHVFDRWWSVIHSNPAIDVNNRFVALIWGSYLERQALTVRRQLDGDKDAISLVKVMREVAVYAGQLARDDFLNAYTKPEYTDAWREAEALFDNLVDPAVPNVVSPSVVTAHIEELRAASERFKTFADKWLAHSDPSRVWPNPGLNDLNACLDLLYERWHQYHSLAAVGPINADIPWLVGTEWETVLDMPWRDNGPTERRRVLTTVFWALMIVAVAVGIAFFASRVLP